MIKLFEIVATISLLLSLIVYSLTIKDPSAYGLLADKIYLTNIEKQPGSFPYSGTVQSSLSELMKSNSLAICYQTKEGKIIPETFKVLLEGSYLDYWLENRIKKRFPRWRQVEWNCMHPSDETMGAFKIKDGRVSMSLPAETPQVLWWCVMHSNVPFLKIQSLAPHALILSAILFVILSIRGLIKRSSIMHSTYVSLTMSALTVLVSLSGLEIYLRFEIPFIEKNIPRIYIDEVGFSYKPHQTYQATNHTDYWTVQKSNSYGFLDREPAIPKPAGRFRIVVVGDSFVEGQQIEMHEKFQVQLEEKLRRKFPDKDLDVVAIGSNGTGQSHQLRFYEHYGPKLEADLIILLAAGNDFANNSTRLYSLDYGWDPLHPALLFFEPTGGGGFQRIDPDVDWYKKRVNKADNASRAAFMDKSFHAILEKYPHWKGSFGDWRPVGDDNRHKMFFAQEMPDVFKDAMSSTKEALRQFQFIAQNDNAHLMVVAIDGWTWETATSKKGRTFDSFQRIQFFREMNEDLSIPFLDLYPIFQNYGNPRKEARFLFDGHWNATGHEWGSRAVTDFLAENPSLLTPLK